MRTNLLERYILRCSPMAHQAWLSLIDKTLLLRSLPFAAFDTQTSTILQDGGQTANNEPISGISVICSASSATSNLSGVVSSKRGQVLDGVVRYGDDRVIVLESKLTEGASEYQAVNINLNGQPVKFERAARRRHKRYMLGKFRHLKPQWGREFETRASSRWRGSVWRRPSDSSIIKTYDWSWG